MGGGGDFFYQEYICQNIIGENCRVLKGVTPLTPTSYNGSELVIWLKILKKKQQQQKQENKHTVKFKISGKLWDIVFV